MYHSCTVDLDRDALLEIAFRDRGTHLGDILNLALQHVELGHGLWASRDSSGSQRPGGDNEIERGRGGDGLGSVARHLLCNGLGLGAGHLVATGRAGDVVLRRRGSGRWLRLHRRIGGGRLLKRGKVVQRDVARAWTRGR